MLAYEGSRQQSLLKRILGEVSLLRLAGLVLLTLIFSVALLFALHYWRYQRIKLSKEEKYYRRFCRKLAKHGMVKLPAEGVWDFALRASIALPHAELMIKSLSQQYIQLRYAQLEAERQHQLMQQFAQAVQNFRL